MADTSPQTLVPAAVSFNLDSKELNITDVEVSLKFHNGSGYEECMVSSGDKGYMLRKGITVEQKGDIKVTIAKTPDKKQDDTIKNLTDSLQNIRKSTDPASYAKDIAAVVQNPGSEQFLSVTFSGYLKEMSIQSPNLTEFTKYVAEFQVFDPQTIKLTN
jgi:uncharacterized protein YhdP